VLFFIVHPAKYWLFKYVAQNLKKDGHEVEWVITSKDVLEDLLKRDGWEYTNIFPEGRRKKYFHPFITLVINTWKTLIRLWKHMWGKHYDMVVSGDIITFIAWLKGIPALVPIDDGFNVVPEYSVSWMWARKLVAPAVTDFGPFNYKKLGYKSNHEWAYINPKYFKPKKSIVKQFNPKGKKYFFLRLVSLTASHDLHKKGINDRQVKKLIALLSKYGKIYINSEKGRELKPDLQKYQIHVDPIDIHNVMYYADMYIGDSQTMASESALMGVPTFRCNDFVGKVAYLEEEQEYGLVYNYKPKDFNKMLKEIEKTLKMKNAKEEWKKRVKVFAKDHIDTTKFWVDLIESYDKSKK
ncbi:MAG TPA: DUF354 domain-containing protein, partial [Candidatus Dojkabacteria bacterium]|nr:DUF354 domain-containing protein [Candidatus Dojkabacteria bacterium]